MLTLCYHDHLGESIKVDLVVASVYCPTGVSAEARQDFYNQFSTFNDECSKRGDIIIIGADLNACIGNRQSQVYRDSEREELLRALGPHGDRYCNNKGIEMTSHLINHGMAATTTFFEKEHIHTWRSHLPDRRKNIEAAETILELEDDEQKPKDLHLTLDNILINQELRKAVIDSGIKFSGAQVSDHNAINIKV